LRSTRVRCCSSPSPSDSDFATSVLELLITPK
jgi:hypothetical protein